MDAPLIRNINSRWICESCGAMCYDCRCAISVKCSRCDMTEQDFDFLGQVFGECEESADGLHDWRDVTPSEPADAA